jgi:hypothetical protein
MGQSFAALCADGPVWLRDEPATSDCYPANNRRAGLRTGPGVVRKMPPASFVIRKSEIFGDAGKHGDVSTAGE